MLYLTILFEEYFIFNIKNNYFSLKNAKQNMKEYLVTKVALMNKEHEKKIGMRN